MSGDSEVMTADPLSEAHAPQDAPGDMATRKTLPVHPPFFAAFPVLALYTANQSLIPTSDLWLPLITCAAAACVLWALFAAVLKSWDKGAALASGVAVTSLLYSNGLGAVVHSSSVTLNLRP